MSDQISVAFIQDYKNTIALLLQQLDSRFRGAVTEDTYTGKAGKAVEQLGAVTAQKRTTRHSDMPLIDTPHAARWVHPEDYEWADLVDSQDKLRMVIDPTNAYAINGSAAMRRALDDEIIAAFLATAKTGENGTTNTAFDTNNAVAVTIGAGAATGMNVAKLRAAKKILMANEVDVDNDPLFVALAAEQHDDLLAETQAISLDFNDRPVLVEGRIKSFMGFNFIDSERLPVNGSSQRRCPVWAKSGMHLGIWNDMETDISRRNDKSGRPWQVYLMETIGATRLEEGKVAEIICAE